MIIIRPSCVLLRQMILRRRFLSLSQSRKLKLCFVCSCPLCALFSPEWPSIDGISVIHPLLLTPGLCCIYLFQTNYCTYYKLIECNKERGDTNSCSSLPHKVYGAIIIWIYHDFWKSVDVYLHVKKEN